MGNAGKRKAYIFYRVENCALHAAVSCPLLLKSLQGQAGGPNSLQLSPPAHPALLVGAHSRYMTTPRIHDPSDLW